MFQNYIKATFRNFRRHQLNTLINLLGLATGITAFVLIMLYVDHEMSYDKNHPARERLFRLTEEIKSEGFVENSSSCPFPTAPTLLNDYPDFIETAVRFFDFQIPEVTITIGDSTRYTERNFYFVDSTVFTMLDFPLKVGDPKTALNQPNTVVLTEGYAKKYFGDENPIGKTLKYEQNLNFQVTGILDERAPSHFDVNGLFSFVTTLQMMPNQHKNWVWNPCWTYIKLREHVKPETLLAQLPDFTQKHSPDFIKDKVTYHVQPIGNIHLDSHLEFEMHPNSNRLYVVIFSIVAFFVLAIACINFVNLTTARAATRTKEIGVRQVVGATRQMLVRQFLSESVVTTLIAFAVGLAILPVLLPWFAAKTGIDLSTALLFQPRFLGMMLLAVIITGILSGLYPAFYLSNIKVVDVMKSSSMKAGRTAKLLRQGLVVFQFAISIVLIISTFAAFRQLHYMLTKDEGYKTANMMLIPISRTQIPGKLEAFKEELLKNHKVQGVSVMNEVLGVNNNNHEFNYPGIPIGQWQYFPALMVDEDFVKTFDIKLLAGRDYDKHRDREDSMSIIVNRSMSKYLGFADPQEAIGQRFNSMSGQEQIIGVVEDFSFKSFHHPVGPFVLDMESKAGNFFFFAKVVAVNLSDTSPDVLRHVEDTWKQFVPNKPLAYSFLDEEISHLYTAEQKMGFILTIFSALAVFIACLGLFGLSSFMAAQRTREIGIRKVLGAHTGNLLQTITREYFYLMLIAIALAFPISWMVNRQWLENFAFQVDFSVLPFVLAGIISLLVALLTVMGIAWKAAQGNPVVALKGE
ncbi:MAG: FtsX-like permease family protein [Saprospiraceae bacterium]